MALAFEPAQPRVPAYYPFFQYLGTRESWRKFVPGFEVAAAVATGR
jgi:hypothetical protein